MTAATTQAQRDYITSLLQRIGVDKAFEAKAITVDMAIDQGASGGYRSPREVARHCNSKATASQVITNLKAISH
ncbi:MAG: hypothetical protein FWF25_06185 [Propionibacteriaceae bacterium]|nr:hypothetical protein [Propionibacteriaceae bacterium]